MTDLEPDMVAASAVTGGALALVLWFFVLPHMGPVSRALRVGLVVLWAFLVACWHVYYGLADAIARALVRGFDDMCDALAPKPKPAPKPKLPWYLADLDEDWADMIGCVQLEYRMGVLGPDALEDDVGRYMAYALAARDKRIEKAREERERRARCLAGATGAGKECADWHTYSGWTREVAPPRGERPKGPPPARACGRNCGVPCADCRHGGGPNENPVRVVLMRDDADG